MDVGDLSNFVCVLVLYGNSYVVIIVDIFGVIYVDEQICEMVGEVYWEIGYLFDLYGVCGYCVLFEGLFFSEMGIFLEMVYLVKFLEIVEGIIGDKVEIFVKL